MFKTIARHLKFDYDITEPKRCCGFGLAEGENSTGIFGEMMHGFSDVSWGQLYLTDLKLSNFDMTVSYDYDQACFMVSGNMKKCKKYYLTPDNGENSQHRKPGQMAAMTVLYLPFSWRIWIALMSTITVGLVYIVIYGFLHPKSELKYDEAIFFLLASLIEESVLRKSQLHSPTIRDQRSKSLEFQSGRSACE